MKNKNTNTKLHSRQIFSMAVNDICNKYGYNEIESFESKENSKPIDIYMNMGHIKLCEIIPACKPIKIDSKFFR